MVIFTATQQMRQHKMRTAQNKVTNTQSSLLLLNISDMFV